MTKTQSVLVTNVVSFIALCTESNRQNYVAFNHDNLAVCGRYQKLSHANSNQDSENTVSVSNLLS